jgi:uncharacterized membrane protein HdeD (DUF308 family)
MSITVNDASAVLRQAVRDTIRKRSLLFLLQGGVMIVAGFLALLFPALMSTGLIELLGWLLVISGAFQSISLVGATQVPYFWMQLVSTALQIVVGYLLISHPEAGVFAIMLLMLVLFMVGGIARIVFALMIRPMPDWGWILASGVVAIVCSVILIGSLPNAAAWLLGILLGIQLMSEGAALAWLAWRLRRGAAAVAA